MTTYFNWRKMWDIIYAVDVDNADAEIAMIKLIKLLRKSHGSFNIQNNCLIFVEHYDLMDYKWSTSVIGSTDKRYQTEKNKEVLKKIEEERSVVKWLLDYVNMRFDGFDEIYLKVFFDRNFLDYGIERIKTKYGLHNDRYYSVIETSEYLIKRAWCLLSPPQSILDIVNEDLNTIQKEMMKEM